MERELQRCSRQKIVEDVWIRCTRVPLILFAAGSRTLSPSAAPARVILSRFGQEGGIQNHRGILCGIQHFSKRRSVFIRETPTIGCPECQSLCLCSHRWCRPFRIHPIWESKRADVLPFDIIIINPDIFFQVYTIHAICHGKFVPCVVSLLPNKQEATYDAGKIHKSCQNGLAPNDILFDFEQCSQEFEFTDAFFIITEYLEKRSSKEVNANTYCSLVCCPTSKKSLRMTSCFILMRRLLHKLRSNMMVAPPTITVQDLFVGKFSRRYAPSFSRVHPVASIKTNCHYYTTITSHLVPYSFNMENIGKLPKFSNDI